jgi:hypothetical protein
MQRRQFLQSVGLLGAAGLLCSPNWVLASNHNAVFVSAASDLANQHYVVALTGDGKLLSKTAITNRAHDIVWLGENRIAALSRRPFNRLFEIDITAGKLIRTVESAPNHHFYGHGFLDTSRGILVTSENHIETGKGQIVLRDATSMQQLAQYESGGIGPHQIAKMPNMDVLVVANGGILTHPARGRAKLNLDTMQPNLSYLALENGRLLDQVTPPDHQNSLRHLAVSQAGQVIVAGQYQGNKRNVQALVFSHRLGAPLSELAGDLPTWQQFEQYCASVAICEHSKTVSVSSPRGGLIGHWQLEDLSLLKTTAFTDCAGLSATPHGYFASNGKGELKFYSQSLHEQGKQNITGLRFDNHILTLNS